MSRSTKPVLVSPEGEDPRELAVLHNLFATGLERYHLRKPGWSLLQVEAWLKQVPDAWRSRIVLHQHHQLVERFGLAGRHWKDDANAPAAPARGTGFTSRSCHDVATLRVSLGHYDAVFFSTLFPSLSKPGHAPKQDVSADLAALLRHRSDAQRRTEVIALGGIDATNTSHAHALGFDNIALLGAVWNSPNPISAYQQISPSFPPLAERTSGFRGAETPIMCLTQEGIALTPVEQVERLCAAGAKWIQLRLKQADAATWLATAKQVVAICRRHGATCIINDNVDVALAAGADGVHLGRLDLDWRAARDRVGPKMILGGTINFPEDVDRAKAAGCLDYVGVGPLRFTTTKQKLAPVLGVEGVRALISHLDGLPAWVIGGVVAEDLPAVRATGATGVAVTAALYRDGRVEENFRTLEAVWSGTNFNRVDAGRETRARTEAEILSR
jgi:thiamine-phosphate pyrophosphorylase